jgi:hypothetical protein
MALSNRYFSMAWPDIHLTEYGFHIHSIERASGNSSKSLNAIQQSYQKLGHFRTITLAWRDWTYTSSSMDSTSTTWKTTSWNSSKSLIAIQHSDQKLWPFRTVTLALSDQTCTSRVWIPHPLHGKRASGNSSKSLIAIQRSDQKLWPFWTVTLAWLDQTSTSPSMDSTSTP